MFGFRPPQGRRTGNGVTAEGFFEASKLDYLWYSRTSLETRPVATGAGADSREEGTRIGVLGYAQRQEDLRVNFNSRSRDLFWRLASAVAHRYPAMPPVTRKIHRSIHVSMFPKKSEFRHVKNRFRILAVLAVFASSWCLGCGGAEEPAAPEAAPPAKAGGEDPGPATAAGDVPPIRP